MIENLNNISKTLILSTLVIVVIQFILRRVKKALSACNIGPEKTIFLLLLKCKIRSSLEI